MPSFHKGGSMSAVFVGNVDRCVRLHVAGRLVCYSTRFLRNLIEAGELSAVRVGKRAWEVKLRDLYQCLYRRLVGGKLRKKEAIEQLLAASQPEPDSRTCSVSVPAVCSHGSTQSEK